MALTSDQQNKVIRGAILANLTKTKVGYDGLATLTHLHSLEGFEDVDKRRISKIAVRLRSKGWRDSDGSTPVVIIQQPAPEVVPKDDARTSYTGPQKPQMPLVAAGATGQAALQFVVGNKLIPIDPEDMHCMYDVYAMARDYYQYPYNFSSLLKASGILYGLMLRMTGGIFDVPRAGNAATANPIPGATPAGSDFAGRGTGAYVLGEGTPQVGVRPASSGSEAAAAALSH